LHRKSIEKRKQRPQHGNGCKEATGYVSQKTKTQASEKQGRTEIRMK